MRTALSAVGVLALFSAAFFVGRAFRERPSDVELTPQASSAFDLQSAPPPFEPAAVPVARPAAPAGPAVLPEPLSEPGGELRSAVRAPAGPVPPRAVLRAAPAPRKSSLLSRFLSRPADFMSGRSPLRSPRAMRAFLNDPRQVDSYLDSPLVRAALRDSSVARSILTNKDVVRTFLSSPALQDAAVVRDLLGSPMLRKMLDCPGIQSALSDPRLLSGLTADPSAAGFLSRNPQSLRALTAVTRK